MNEIRDLVHQRHDVDPSNSFRAQQKLRAVVDQLDWSDAVLREEIAGSLAAELAATVSGQSDDPNLQFGYATYLRTLAKQTGQDETDIATRPKHSVKARILLCELLGQVGSDDQASALEEALEDPRIRDAARRALERIGSPVAVGYLIEALSRHHDPVFRLGVIGSLAKQRWRNSMAALRKLTNDPDASIRLAAAEALAEYPETANDAFILAANDDTSRGQARIGASRVRLAGTLVSYGNLAGAAEVLKSVVNDPGNGPWKGAARRELTRVLAFR